MRKNKDLLLAVLATILITTTFAVSNYAFNGGSFAGWTAVILGISGAIRNAAIIGVVAGLGLIGVGVALTAIAIGFSFFSDVYSLGILTVVTSIVGVTALVGYVSRKEGWRPWSYLLFLFSWLSSILFYVGQQHLNLGKAWAIWATPPWTSRATTLVVTLLFIFAYEWNHHR